MRIVGLTDLLGSDVMDQYTGRIIGFGINAGIVDRAALCRMFNRAIRRQAVPKYLSYLRILGVTEIKTVSYVPMSHLFVERLIGTIRREYLAELGNALGSRHTVS